MATKKEEITTYNKRNIKAFKGKMVSIKYSHTKQRQTYTNTLYGLITANTTDHILFRVNKDRPEIPLNYSQLLEIKIPEKWETT